MSWQKLNLKKVNKIVKFYVNITNFGPLECPNCHSHDLIRWGSYERNVIFFSHDDTKIASMIVKIQRVRCKGCGKTHALLPIGIIPYKQFSDEVISKILLELIDNTLGNVSDKYQIDSSVINKWYCQYRKYHLSKVNTLVKIHNRKKALKEFLVNYISKINYIINYKRCFMQIKLGFLGLCPS